MAKTSLGIVAVLFGAQNLFAQDAPAKAEAPSMGFGVLAGKETENTGKIYGTNFGAECTWQFLREHWVQGRLRTTYIHINKGRGVSSPYYDSPSQGDFFVGSCDWIIRLSKPHGPYLLLGAGLNYHEVKSGSGFTLDVDRGTAISLAGGLGFLIRNSVEIELRSDVMYVGKFLFENKDAICTSLVVRKRF